MIQCYVECFFLVENVFTTEGLNKDVVYKDKNFKDEEIWGDIGLTHLLTYNKAQDQLRYEIRTFTEKLNQDRWWRVLADRELSMNKSQYYEHRTTLVWDNLVNKNKKIIERVLLERKMKSAKILHKALYFYEHKDPEQELRDSNLEKSRHYFYEKKRKLFEQLDISEYLDWKAEWSSKIVEDKYFSFNNMEALKRKYESYMSFVNEGGTVINPMEYLEQNFV